MIKPKIPKNDKARIKDLESYNLLDTLPDEDYDALTAIAAQICNVPISLISLIDKNRQWFKSHHGLAVSETPREFAFCAHAINDPNQLFEVSNALIDDRFSDNPLVVDDPHVIFYAGIPLISEDGLALGTLCVIDHKPHKLDEAQINSLRALSKQVTSLFQLRKKKVALENAITKLERQNMELEKFAVVAAHDLKSPLVGVSSMARLLTMDYGSKLDEDGRQMLEMIVNSADKLSEMIDGLLKYSQSDKILLEEKADVDVSTLIASIKALFKNETSLEINLRSTIKTLYVNKVALDRVFINLVANAVKYSDKPTVKIELGIDEDDRFYHFYVHDNGPGIDPKDHNRVFDIFEVLKSSDKYGKPGNGIGLATVKSIIQKSGGEISLESEVGCGAKFSFSIEK